MSQPLDLRHHKQDKRFKAWIAEWFRTTLVQPFSKPRSKTGKPANSWVSADIQSLTLFRVLKLGFQHFFRNGLLTIATTSIMILTLLSVLIMVMVNLVTNTAIEIIHEKIDLRVEITDGTPEEDIQSLRNELEVLPQVKQVSYVSQEEALREFQEEYQEIPNFLETYGIQNPLRAYLKVTTTDPKEHPTIIRYLDRPEHRDIVNIAQLNSDLESKSRTETLIRITDGVKQVGYTINILFAFIALLIILNALRITIYNRRTELQIMKVVGASHFFIRGPLVVEGILYGVIATIVSTVLFYPVVQKIAPQIGGFFENTLDILHYYQSHVLAMIGLQLLIGVGIGTIGSLLAMHQYLRKRVEF